MFQCLYCLAIKTNNKYIQLFVLVSIILLKDVHTSRVLELSDG